MIDFVKRFARDPAEALDYYQIPLGSNSRGADGPEVAPKRGPVQEVGRIVGRAAWEFLMDGTLDTGSGPRRLGDILSGKGGVGGEWEPIDDMVAGETLSEYLRRKHNANVGRNYGPHDDLTEQAHVKDWRGNRKPYHPKK